jgi:hypothetical protein
VGFIVAKSFITEKHWLLEGLAHDIASSLCQTKLVIFEG